MTLRLLSIAVVGLMLITVRGCIEATQHVQQIVLTGQGAEE